MAFIRSIDKIAEKWARVTPARAEDYRAGVEAPKKKWDEQAIAANDRYVAGVTKAATEGRYAKGVSKAGFGKWQKRTIQKGPTRFAEGVMIAKPDYHAGFAPYVETIAATELPPRGPKGDPKNIARVAAIAAALHKKKLETLG